MAHIKKHWTQTAKGKAILARPRAKRTLHAGPQVVEAVAEVQPTIAEMIRQVDQASGTLLRASVALQQRLSDDLER